MTPDFWPTLLPAEPVREPLVPLWALEWGMNLFLFTWLFWVGACVGSFLNVVVYRLPRGRNLAHPGSFCPRCRRPIRLRDNIPVLSWLVLRGRCRDCASPIPTRYFLVELTVAALFVAVALLETQVPGRFPPPAVAGQRPLISPYDVLPFWCTYASHMVLLTTLLGAALIDASGHRTPRRLFAPALLLGLMLPVVWPNMRRLPAFAYDGSAAWQPGLIDGATGLVVGALIGAVLGAAWWRGSSTVWPRFGLVGMFAAVGVTSGWQAALETAAASAVLFLGAVIWLRLRSSQAIAPLAALVLLAALPRVIDLDVRLSAAVVWPSRLEAVIAIMLLVVASLAARAAGRLALPQYFAPPPDDPPEVSPPREVVAAEPPETDTTEPTEPADGDSLPAAEPSLEHRDSP